MLVDPREGAILTQAIEALPGGWGEWVYGYAVREGRDHADEVDSTEDETQAYQWAEYEAARIRDEVERRILGADDVERVDNFKLNAAGYMSLKVMLAAYRERRGDHDWGREPRSLDEIAEAVATRLGVDLSPDFDGGSFDLD